MKATSLLRSVEEIRSQGRLLTQTGRPTVKAKSLHFPEQTHMSSLEKSEL